MNRFVLLALVVGLLMPLEAREYNDADIEQMKARYQPRSAKLPSKRLPKKFWKMEYEKPRLVNWMLPYRRWEKEYRSYFKRHYGDSRLLFRPELIVMHYTVTPSARSVYDGFVRGANMSAGDLGTVRGHVSVQLMIDTSGKIYRLMPLDRRCTGAYGVNHKALSIEMVARNEAELLGRPKQVFASFCLVRYLMTRYGIPLDKVYAHYEVSIGRRVVPEYLDLADQKFPHSYPPRSARSDPGRTYMRWLRTYVGKTGPASPEQEI